MINPFVLLLLGFVLGMLTGFLGVGGGFLLTPALNILGFHMLYAIGTSFSVIVGNSLIGAMRHHRLGNVDIKLGIVMGLLSMIGVELGKRFVFHLENLNLAETYVRVAYIFFLLLISIFMLREYYQFQKLRFEKKRLEEKKHFLALQISRIKIPPNVSLPHSGVDLISIWVIIFSSIFIGFLSGFMGIGGGFIGFPLLIYVIGVPTLIAIGTSLVTVFFTSCYGMIVYANKGYAKWMAVLIILAGSFVGLQLGVYATRYVPSMKIRLLFALFLFTIVVSILLKQINKVTLSSYLLVGSACLLSFTILLLLMKRRLAQILNKSNSQS